MTRAEQAASQAYESASTAIYEILTLIDDGKCELDTALTLAYNARESAWKLLQALSAPNS